MYNSGRLIFINTEIAKSGETLNAYVEFLRGDLVKEFMTIGRKFSILEGTHVLGEGEILEIC